MFKSLRFLCTGLHIRRSLSSEISNRLGAPKVDRTTTKPNLDHLLDVHKDTIFFSSYQQENTPSWGQAQVINRYERKQSEAQLRENIRVKPIALAAQYMEEPYSGPETTTNKENEEESVKLDESDRQYQVSDYRPRDGSWMHDYESFEDSEDDTDLGVYGTPDPSIPISKTPCFGCGSPLQCAEPSLPGYLPSEIFVGRPDSYLRTITCQRCHFLKNYNTVIDVTVKPEEYVRLISSISDQFALVILMVDLTDFPCSIWPQIHTIIGTKRPVFVVGNKVDLLPRDSPGYLRHVKQCLESAIQLAGIPQNNIKHTSLISAETGFGVEELITKLHNVWRYKGDVYLLGCTNVGKSTLFNALLRSDYCKTKAASIIGKATASPWPGTTMRMLKFPILRPNDWRVYVRTKRILSSRAQRVAEEQLRRDQALETKKVKHATLIGHIGNTFHEKPSDETNDEFSMGKSSGRVLSINEKDRDYVNCKWCFDTPGVVQPQQALNLLTTEELLLVIPKQMITPRTYKLKVGMSLFLAGLGRMDYLAGPDDAINVTVFASTHLPVVIVASGQAQRIYETFLGTELLRVPFGDAERMQRWPALRGEEIQVLGKGHREAACDILFSSCGWIGVNAENEKLSHFKVWTPEGRGIVKRIPSLIPNAMNLSGKRIRGSLAYMNHRSFV